MRVATIGTSFITEWFLQAVEANPGIECVGLYSRRKETGQVLADKYNIKTVFTNLEEMLALDNLDFIYVASPNSLHYEYTKKALLAGKNVICEKPFTSNAKEAKELYALAKEKNLFLFEAITTIHLPNYKLMKTKLDLLGNLKIVQCNFSQYSSKYDKFLAGENPNVFTTQFSGGALMDINIYNTHFIMGLFGKPKKVQYFANIADNGIDTSGILVFDYGHFLASAVGAKDSRSKCLAQIQGEKGYITVNSETSRCKQIEIHLNNSTDVEVIELQDQEVALTYELGDFKKIFDQKDYDTCFNKLEYSLSIMEVIDQAKQSAGIVFDADK